jgi:hypothetical protein
LSNDKLIEHVLNAGHLAGNLADVRHRSFELQNSLEADAILNRLHNE